MRHLGELDAGVRYHSTALRLAGELGIRYEQARAHDGIAAVMAAQGDTAGARTQWVQAHKLFTELGTPEAADVVDRLRSLGARTAHPL